MCFYKRVFEKMGSDFERINLRFPFLCLTKTLKNVEFRKFWLLLLYII